MFKFKFLTIFIRAFIAVCCVELTLFTVGAVSSVIENFRLVFDSLEKIFNDTIEDEIIITFLKDGLSHIKFSANKEILTEKGLLNVLNQLKKEDERDQHKKINQLNESFFYQKATISFRLKKTKRDICIKTGQFDNLANFKEDPNIIYISIEQKKHGQQPGMVLHIFDQKKEQKFFIKLSLTLRLQRDFHYGDFEIVELFVYLVLQKLRCLNDVFFVGGKEWLKKTLFIGTSDCIGNKTIIKAMDLSREQRADLLTIIEVLHLSDIKVDQYGGNIFFLQNKGRKEYAIVDFVAWDDWGLEYKFGEHRGILDPDKKLTITDQRNSAALKILRSLFWNPSFIHEAKSKIWIAAKEAEWNDEELKVKMDRLDQYITFVRNNIEKLIGPNRTAFVRDGFNDYFRKGKEWYDQTCLHKEQARSTQDTGKNHVPDSVQKNEDKKNTHQTSKKNRDDKVSNINKNNNLNQKFEKQNKFVINECIKKSLNIQDAGNSSNFSNQGASDSQNNLANKDNDLYGLSKDLFVTDKKELIDALKKCDKKKFANKFIDYNLILNNEDLCKQLLSFFQKEKCTCNFFNYSFDRNFPFPVKRIILSPNVTEIPQHAFAEQSNLSSIYMRNVKQIGVYAFRECINLHEVFFGNKLDHVGNGAFEDCSKIENIDISTTSPQLILGYSVFKACKSLSQVKISARQIATDYHIFSACNNLTKIEILSNNCSFGNSCLSECQKLSQFNVTGLCQIGWTDFEISKQFLHAHSLIIRYEGSEIDKLPDILKITQKSLSNPIKMIVKINKFSDCEKVLSIFQHYFLSNGLKNLNFYRWEYTLKNNLTCALDFSSSLIPANNLWVSDSFQKVNNFLYKIFDYSHNFPFINPLQFLIKYLFKMGRKKISEQQKTIILQKSIKCLFKDDDNVSDLSLPIREILSSNIAKSSLLFSVLEFLIEDPEVFRFFLSPVFFQIDNYETKYLAQHNQEGIDLCLQLRTVWILIRQVLGLNYTHGISPVFQNQCPSLVPMLTSLVPYFQFLNYTDNILQAILEVPILRLDKSTNDIEYHFGLNYIINNGIDIQTVIGKHPLIEWAAILGDELLFHYLFYTAVRKKLIPISKNIFSLICFGGNKKLIEYAKFCLSDWYTDLSQKQFCQSCLLSFLCGGHWDWFKNPVMQEMRVFDTFSWQYKEELEKKFPRLPILPICMTMPSDFYDGFGRDLITELY